MSVPSIPQNYVNVAGTDGKLYMKSRSRPLKPHIPEVPVLDKNSLLLGFRSRHDGELPPPTGGDITAARDVALKPWYDRWKHVDAASPYLPTGPSKTQVGTTLTWAECQLPSNWAAGTSPTTQSTNVTGAIGSSLAPIRRKVFWGVLVISGAGCIFADDCAFPGPSNPGGSLTGESAVVNCANAQALSRIRDSSIWCQTPHPRLNGVKGCRHILERCHIFWCTDGDGPHDRIATETQKVGTQVEIVGCRFERLVYWPGSKAGKLFAAQGPKYWNAGTGAYQSSTSGATVRTSANDLLGFFDDQHDDGNHCDCIEIHSASGNGVFNTTTGKWTSTGILVWGNALICDDATGQGDPSTMGLPVPLLGYGDAISHWLPASGQKPNMGRPVAPSSWNNPLKANDDPATGGRWAGYGVSLYIGQVRNILFESATSVVCHHNYLNGGNMGMQEQKKSTPAYIEFHFYDNLFGPDYYMWATGRNIYPVRINDLAGQSMPSNWLTTVVRIQPHPVTGSQPFGTGGNNKWWDPQGKQAPYNGDHLQPLMTGDGTNAGVRFL